MIKTQRRWIKPLFWQPGVTSQVFTIGRVQLTEIEVMEDCYIDCIAWVNGAAVSGNLRVGLYGPIATEETCLGAALVPGTDNGDIAQSGTNTGQQTTFTPVFVRRGRYYLGIEADNTTAAYMRQSNTTQVPGWGQLYDRGGGYGAFTDPCPAVTTSGSNVPTMMARISKMA